MNFIKKNLIFLMLFLVMIFSFAGCQGDSAINKYAGDINYNGIKISLPCSIADLGEGFSYAYDESEKEWLKKYDIGLNTLYYNTLIHGEDMFRVALYFPMEDTPFSEAQICYIEASSDNLGGNAFSAGDLYLGMDRTKAENILGKSDKASPIEENTEYYIFPEKQVGYGLTGYNNMLVVQYSGGKLSNIRISYLPHKLVK